MTEQSFCSPDPKDIAAQLLVFARTPPPADWIWQSRAGPLLVSDMSVGHRFYTGRLMFTHLFPDVPVSWDRRPLDVYTQAHGTYVLAKCCSYMLRSFEPSEISMSWRRQLDQMNAAVNRLANLPEDGPGFTMTRSMAA